MVASTECGKPKAMSATKVSKPLMEKKRRARINQCLDQLKSLLESHYSSSIRKRKLEKADILELTVKHLKHLQKIQKFSSVAPEPDQMGFRSCVTNINHYLLTADHLSGPDRWKLSQLTSRLGSGRPEECGSTMDSGLSHAQTQDVTRRQPPSPVGPEESNTVPCNLCSPATEHALPRKHGQPFSEATKTTTPKMHCKVLNGLLSVWRPW